MTSLSRAELLFEARGLYETRRGLMSALPRELVANAPWDVLLHLFLAEDSVEACDTLVTVSGLPKTVTKRWIAHLEKCGHVKTVDDTVFLCKRGQDLVTKACEAAALSRNRVEATHFG